MIEKNLNSSIGIAVLGMHRSGTSCLMGSLQQMGLTTGPVSNFNKYNAKGNRENPGIISLNNKLLRYNGASWKYPPTQILWQDKHIRERDYITERISKSTKYKWGIKDPRLLLTLDFWRLDNLISEFVATIRHPAAVANSLECRDKIPIQQGLKLWFTYNTRLLWLRRRENFEIISFDTSSSIYNQKIHTISKKLLNKQKIPTVSKLFFDKTLRTHTDNYAIKLPGPIINLYNELCSFV